VCTEPAISRTQNEHSITEPTAGSKPVAKTAIYAPSVKNLATA